MTAERKRVLYGRRHGRRLRPARKRLVDEVLPQIAVDPNQLSSDPAAWFGRPIESLWLEVGFGAGEHLLAQAGRHPEIGFIGCEPYINGVARMLSEMGGKGGPGWRDNIRVFTDDARLLIERLPPGSVGRAFVLFPDPWPKTRHHRRRFVAPRQLDLFARVLSPGAELRLATDHMGYLRWMLFHCLRHGAFEWLARGPTDWRERPSDWPPTRYEEKAVARGESCVYLRLKRRPDPGLDDLPRVALDAQKALVERSENA